MAAKTAKWAEKISRRLFIGGNWKCNGTTKSATTLINDTVNKIVFNNKKMEILISPVYIHLLGVKQMLSKKIYLAAQNLSPFPNGPYTGEITAEQLKDFGINWVLLGHSERRSYFKESNNVRIILRKFLGRGIKSKDRS